MEKPGEMSQRMDLLRLEKGIKGSGNMPEAKPPHDLTRKLKFKVRPATYLRWKT
jgi:hypothetical protein